MEFFHVKLCSDDNGYFLSPTPTFQDFLMQRQI